MVATTNTLPARSFSAALPGRTLPNSLEAEEQLLSCCLLDGNEVVARAIVAGIKPEDFYDQKHAIIFAIILDLYGRQKAIEASVVAEELKTRRELDAVGGYAFLTQVSSRMPTTLHAAYLIEKVKEQALLRAIIRSRTGSVEDCYNYTGDIETFIAELTAKENRVTAVSSSINEESVQTAATTLLEDLTKPPSQRKAAMGLVSWGIKDIDYRCGMMAPGDLVVVAGPPSSGKSSVSDQAAWACAQAGRTALVWTYEMSVTKKIIRMAQQISRLNLKQFDQAPTDLKLSFTNAVRDIRANQHLRIFERDTSLARVQARGRAVSRRTKVGLIVVDFLQYLARLEPSINKERTDEKLGRLTAGLKSLGRELECPVMVLSSLNREGYKNGAKSGMANLKASGEIESDADVVAMLDWPDVNPRTGAKQDPLDETQNTFYVDFRVEKGRDSGVSKVPLMFTRTATRFDGLAR